MSEVPVALTVEDLHKSFGALEVLKGISLLTREHDVASVIGSSGSGKSTLLQCISFLETPDSGRVIFGGEEVKVRADRAGRPVVSDLRQIERIKKLSLVAMTVVATMFAGQSIAGDWSKIRIATDGAYAPWSDTDSSGKLVGFELDLAEDLCKRMNAECEIIPQAWDGMIPALQAGKYDAIMAGMSITDKRKKVITFSRNYAATPARFVVSEKSPMANFKTAIEDMDLTEVNAKEKATIDDIVAQFKGKTVGVQTVTRYENFLREYLGDNVTIRTYETQEYLDLDLLAGRVDTALAAMSYWVPFLKSNKGKGMKMVGPGMTGGPFGHGVGVGIRQKDQDLADMFSKAINGAIADGTVSRLAVKWFNFDASTKQ